MDGFGVHCNRVYCPRVGDRGGRLPPVPSQPVQLTRSAELPWGTIAAGPWLAGASGALGDRINKEPEPTCIRVTRSVTTVKWSVTNKWGAER